MNVKKSWTVLGSRGQSWTVLGSPKIRGQSHLFLYGFHSKCHLINIFQKIILSGKYDKMNVLDSRGQSWTVQ